jgi:hypothetical protein
VLSAIMLNHLDVQKRKTQAMVLLFLGMFSQALFTKEPDVLAEKLFDRVVSKNGDVIVELRGQSEDRLPSQAWVVFPDTKERIFLAKVETYIMDPEISDDGRYIVLPYHVSSGGWFEAFERSEDGYRKLLNNQYAYEQVKNGRVPGFAPEEIPELSGKNMFCGLYLAQSPDRLIFTFWDTVHLTYSLQKKRITEWQRTLLEYDVSTMLMRTMAIYELSNCRAIAESH